MGEADQRESFARILEGYDPAIGELAWQARALMYDVMPRVVEVVWEHQQIAGYGTGPKKMSEQYCYITAQKKHVNLGFYYGAELPDPENLLEGTGQLMRHIKLRSIEDVQRPAVRTLVEVASTHRVPPLKEQ